MDSTDSVSIDEGQISHRISGCYVHVVTRLHYLIDFSDGTKTSKMINIGSKLSKGKVFPYSFPSIGPGADPGVQEVILQVTFKPLTRR